MQRGNGCRKLLEIVFWLHQTGFQQRQVRSGRGHTFAEPQRSRVVLPGVIDWLERLWTNALHIPQMKELVSAYRLKVSQVLQFIRRKIDRGRVRVLHTTACRRVRKVIDEDVRIERPIIHPGSFCCRDLLQRLDQLVRIVIARVAIEDDTILSASLLEVTLGKFTKLAGSINEAIVVGRPENMSQSLAGCGGMNIPGVNIQ